MPHEPRHSEFVIATHNGEPLILDDNARRRHLYAIGQTGTGKTTLFLSLIAQDLVAGRGLAVIDPLGHLAEATLNLVPSWRAHQVRIIDPSDLMRPIAFNVLDNTHPDMHATVADDVVAAFIHIFGKDAVGDRSQQVLRNSIRLLLHDPNATLLCIPKLLTNDSYRAQMLRRLAHRDPMVANYWRDQFAAYDPKFRAEVTSPILNKLDAVLSAPAIRNIIGQPRSTIDLRRTMDEGRILVVSLRKGLLGENNAHVLGALLISKLAQAAFARADTPAHLRRPFYIYADEFQDYASAGFIRIASQARAFALGLALAHQFLGQLSEPMRQAVFGNVASFISFRIGAEDATMIAKHLAMRPDIQAGGLGFQTTTPDHLLATLPNYQAFARTLIDDTPTEALHLSMLPTPLPINHRPHRLITNSRIRFGRDRHLVEERIRRFLAS